MNGVRPGSSSRGSRRGRDRPLTAYSSAAYSARSPRRATRSTRRSRVSRPPAVQVSPDRGAGYGSHVREASPPSSGEVLRQRSPWAGRQCRAAGRGLSPRRPGSASRSSSSSVALFNLWCRAELGRGSEECAPSRVASQRAAPAADGVAGGREPRLSSCSRCGTAATPPTLPGRGTVVMNSHWWKRIDGRKRKR